MKPVLMKVHMTIEVPVDSDNNDAASLRGTFSWLEELQDKAAEQGEVTHLRLEGLPPRITLVDSRDEVLMAHLRAAQREGGS